ncbi:MAG: hypothetical protein H6735_25725 [Alphaproteobacteria bacterium]|nr:hypothetical protein [Alphaproteobacteria bacterium]
MRRFRAIVIAIAIFANLVVAIPTAKIDDDELADPEYRQSDVRNWYRWTGGLGMDEERFRELALGIMTGWRDAVRLVRAPFQPFFSLVHTNQQWGLFAVVGERKETVVIEVRRNGQWETLYRRLDPEHTWHDDQLKYRRIRGVWDGVKEEPKGTYKRLTVWLAKEIFTEQPDVDRVRVVLERSAMSLPWETVDPTVERRAERYHRRNEVMDDPEQEAR